MSATVVGTIRVRFSGGTYVARVLGKGVTASSTGCQESAAMVAAKKVWGYTVTLGTPVFVPGRTTTLEFPVHRVGVGRHRPAGNAGPTSIVAFLITCVVEEGDDVANRLLVDSLGPIKADELIKIGRRVCRRLGAPVHVRGLLTAGGAA